MNPMEISLMESIIESVLFVTGELVPLAKLAEVLEEDPSAVRDCISAMTEKYKSQNRGFRIIQVNDAFQMCSAPENFQYIQKAFEKSNKKHLTQTLLETLAIIAYKQPITKGQIEEIRGVNADHAVNKLIEYELVTEKGRLEVPGRPILFGTTDNFLKFFGFTKPEDLPQLPEHITEQLTETEPET